MIELSEITKTYDGKNVIDTISLSVKKGEIFGLIGPSGAGKSTILKIINLLETPTHGSYRFEGVLHTKKEKDRNPAIKKMAMLFQKPVMFKASVEDNVAMGLKFRGVPENERKPRIESALREVGLEGYGPRSAKTLSGGEAQRVAMARAIVVSPDLLLLDEPTANLDPRTTRVIEEIILRLNREHGMTIIMCTHDLVQGQRLCHRIGVVIDGRMQQVGTPVRIFHHPDSQSVAHYVGMENVFGCRVISCESGVIVLESGGVSLLSVSDIPVGSQVTACFRAEDVTLFVGEVGTTSARNLLTGTITDIGPHGPYIAVRVHCGIPVTAFLTQSTVDDLSIREGSTVTVSVKASAVHAFPDDPLTGKSP